VADQAIFSVLKMIATRLFLSFVFHFVSAQYTCNTKTTRGDCGDYGIQQSDCEQRGCCWNPTSEQGQPWCFFKTNPSITCNPSGDRTECGYKGITDDECFQKNCCWGPTSQDNDPWCFASSQPTNKPTLVPTYSPDLPPFSDAEVTLMSQYFFNNIDMGGSGAILASPSTHDPDYYYHWMRDAAISMNVVLTLGGTAGGNDAHVRNYIKWVQKAQHAKQANFIDVRGEPKFFTNGEVFNGAWCRPQNDGAGLRSLVLSRFALRLLNGTDNEKSEGKALWDTIKLDLDYVAQQWKTKCCDLWEETSAIHFFTVMVQRCGLIVGTQVAKMLNEDASLWQNQLDQMKSTLDSMWNGGNQIIEYAIDPPQAHGLDKYHNLDVAVLLGALYGDANDGVYDVLDKKVMLTVAALIDVFRDGSFPINQIDDTRGIPGSFLGRYPNDTYSGTSTTGLGNPWILATNALGEYYYRHALAVMTKPVSQFQHEHYQKLLGEKYSPDRKTLAKALGSQADGQLNRIRQHVAQDKFHLGEQLNRQNGMQQGANDLTWSYGTILAALSVRSTLHDAFRDPGFIKVDAAGKNF